MVRFYGLDVNFITVFVILFLKKSFCFEEIFRQIVKSGYPLRTTDIIANHSAQSSMECAQYCRKREKCVGFNFKSSKTKSDYNCQLSNSKRCFNSEVVISGKDAVWSFYQVLQTEPPVGSYENPGKSCLDILRNNQGQCLKNEEFWITVDSSGPLKVFCDMTTDQGGWTLVSNVVYQSPGFRWYIQNDFRKISELGSGDIVLTPHALGTLKDNMSFKQLRFNCFKKIPSRIINIATTQTLYGERIVQYFTSNSNDFPNACTSFYKLHNDNSQLASKNCSQWGAKGSNGNFGRWSHKYVMENNRLFDRVAFIHAKNYWNVLKPKEGPGNGIERRWECDDFGHSDAIQVNSGDFWKVFVR